MKSDQFVDRLSVIDQVMGPIASVVKHGIGGVDTEVVV